MRNAVIIFVLVVAVVLFSGCAVKEAPAEAPTVKSISSDISEDIDTLSATVDEELEEINFTLVDENLK